MCFRVVVTTVVADKIPVSLELFRSYMLPFDVDENRKHGFKNPKGNSQHFTYRIRQY